MENAENLLERIERIAENDGRYRREAYLFIYAALDYTVHQMGRQGAADKSRHITGQELAGGIRTYAREQFGPMTQDVLQHWGLNETLDFGKIVYNLIEAGMMSKTDDDRVEDFQNVYTFAEAFDPREILRSPKGMDLERL